MKVGDIVTGESTLAAIRAGCVLAWNEGEGGLRRLDENGKFWFTDDQGIWKDSMTFESWSRHAKEYTYKVVSTPRMNPDGVNIHEAI